MVNPTVDLQYSGPECVIMAPGPGLYTAFYYLTAKGAHTFILSGRCNKGELVRDWSVFSGFSHRAQDYKKLYPITWEGSTSIDSTSCC